MIKALMDIQSIDMISSNNIARRCNVVFSEYISKKAFNKLNLSDVNVYDSGDNFVLYKTIKFDLRENDIIFTTHFFLKDLISKLSKVNKLKNIKLVTHWSDEPIDKKLFELKPSCISEWYGINVNHDDPNLIPIPLGIAGDFSTKNLLANDFTNFEKKSSKEHLLYINFQKNTNNNERTNIAQIFDDKKWALLKEPNLSLNEYKDDLSKSTFVLCPHGNGFDTHRLWETLYAGSIPIVKKHLTFKTLENLPVLFVDDFNEVDYELLIKTKNNIEQKSYDYSKLSLDYWVSIFNSKKISSNNSQFLCFNKFEEFQSKIKYKVKKYFYRYKKRIDFRINQLKKLHINITFL